MKKNGQYKQDDLFLHGLTIQVIGCITRTVYSAESSLKKKPMPAREVTSNQFGVHQHLRSVVQKHLDCVWQKPISDFSREVFLTIQDWLAKDARPVILDSGCGTGESTANLARMFPDCKILGFDRSEVRLDKLVRKTEVPENCLVVRADADDLWRQLADSNFKPTHHYLTFPNPYPKAAQLNQRWHGSPVFPYLIALGGKIELRSNWRIYLDEFSDALAIATKVKAAIEPYAPDVPLSAFETKYHQGGQTLWLLTADLTLHTPYG